MLKTELLVPKKGVLLWLLKERHALLQIELLASRKEEPLLEADQDIGSLIKCPHLGRLHVEKIDVMHMHRQTPDKGCEIIMGEDSKG